MTVAAADAALGLREEYKILVQTSFRWQGIGFSWQLTLGKSASPIKPCLAMGCRKVLVGLVGIGGTDLLYLCGLAR